MSKEIYIHDLKNYVSGDILCPYLKKRLADMTDDELVSQLYQRILDASIEHWADIAEIIIGRWLNGKTYRGDV